MWNNIDISGRELDGVRQPIGKEKKTIWEKGRRRSTAACQEKGRVEAHPGGPQTTCITGPSIGGVWAVAGYRSQEKIRQKKKVRGGKSTALSKRVPS